MFINFGLLDVEILYSFARYSCIICQNLTRSSGRALYASKNFNLNFVTLIKTVGVVSEFFLILIAGPCWYGINSTEENLSSPAASNHLPRKQNLWKLNLCLKPLIVFIFICSLYWKWLKFKEGQLFILRHRFYFG